MAEEPPSSWKRVVARALALADDRQVAEQEGRRVSRLTAFVHFWVLVGRSFVRNRCPVRASALTFSSLLAMIPMLALVLSITTSILKNQGKEPVERFVDEMVKSMMPYVGAEEGNDPDLDPRAQARLEEARKARDQATDKINEFIAKTQSGTIGATGAIMLMFVAISMLSRIEATFNDIWGVARGRSWYMRVVLYWAAITLGPLILVSALGLATTGQIRLAAGTVFTAADLKDPAALRVHLLERQSPVAQWVWDHLPETGRQRLVTGGDAAKDAAALAADLNRVLEGPLLYEERRFAGVKLSEESRALLARQPQGPDLVRLNRLLLEDAYQEVLRGEGPVWQKWLRRLADMPWVKSLVSTYLPMVVLSFTFAMIYLLLPNTRVLFSAAVVGGFTAGILWNVNNKLGVLFVSRVTSNNAVYGSLAVVPVFMIGMYFGWLILLFGAQVAYAWQNRQAYLQERLAEGINARGREFAALRLMAFIARQFQAGERPPGLNDLALHCGVPTRLASQLLGLLGQARLVLEVYDREVRYAPSRPLEKITLHDILLALRTGNGTELSTRDDAMRRRLRAEVDRVDAAEATAGQAVTLRQLLEEANPQESLRPAAATGA